ncbi:MAG: acyltransferase [Desulfobacterales bacterium]
MTSALPQTLFTVQALRAVAACAVLVHHVLFMLVHNAGYSFDVSSIGASGVDLFFVISGFIMVYTSYSSFGKPKASISFVRRRAIRIAPIYWIYTTAVVLLLAFAPGLFSETRFDWNHVISSYLFLLSENTAGQVGTVMQTGWTLCFEVYFYLLFAVLLNLPRRFFLAMAGTLFAAGVILGMVTEPAPWATVATNPIVLEFFFGAVIAYLFMNGFVLSRLIAIAFIILGIAIVVMTEDADLGIWTRAICWGLPASALLLGAVSLESGGMNVPRGLVALGDSSYSLYLVHPFIVPAIGKLWLALRLSDHAPPALLFAAAFCCSLAAGHASYLAIEKPITRWLLRTWKSPEGRAMQLTDAKVACANERP